MLSVIRRQRARRKSENRTLNSYPMKRRRRNLVSLTHSDMKEHEDFLESHTKCPEGSYLKTELLAHAASTCEYEEAHIVWRTFDSKKWLHNCFLLSASFNLQSIQALLFLINGSAFWELLRNRNMEVDEGEMLVLKLVTRLVAWTLGCSSSIDHETTYPPDTRVERSNSLIQFHYQMVRETSTSRQM